MKRIMRVILFFTFILVAFSVKSQTLRNFDGVISIYGVSGSGPTYDIEAFYQDALGYYSSDSVDVGDFIYILNGSSCARLEVTAIASNSGGLLDITVNDIDAVMLAPPSGVAGITTETPNKDLPLYMSGISNSLRSCVFSHFAIKSDTLVSGSGGGSIDGNRAILRELTAGVTPGGSTPAELLEYMFFAPPTISLNLSPTTTVYEVGTSNAITLSGSTTNPGGATLSAGVLTRTNPSSNTVNSFGTGTSYSSGITFAPTSGGSGDYVELAYSFQATQAWVSGAESGTATSNTRTVTAVYPIFYGMSAIDYSAASGTTIYLSGLTKLVQAEGNKTVSLTGTNEFIYYIVPKTWGDFTLSTIIDHNGFDVTPSFTAYDITVSSSGLVNDWVNQDCKLYKSNSLTTATGFAFQFIR